MNINLWIQKDFYKESMIILIKIRFLLFHVNPIECIGLNKSLVWNAIELIIPPENCLWFPSRSFFKKKRKENSEFKKKSERKKPATATEIISPTIVSSVALESIAPNAT